VEVPDIQESWLHLFLLVLIKELWACGVSFGPKGCDIAGRSLASGVMEPGVRVNGLGNAGWGTARFIRAFSGRMTAELIICLENPLVNGGAPFSFLGRSGTTPLTEKNEAPNLDSRLAAARF